MSDYIFYLTDESFDYPTGYGTETEHQYMPHGFEIEDLDMNTFNAYGDYEEMNDKCKTLKDLRDYIKSHYREIGNVNESCRELYTDTTYEDESKSNWENFDILLEQIDKKVDAGFWDKDGNYKEEIIKLKAGEE